MLAALAGVLLLALSACSPVPEQATITVTCANFAEQPIILAVADTPFAVGRTFTVGLCADPGFQWPESATINDTSVVQQTAHKRAAGQEIWTFKALITGHATLQWTTTAGAGGVERTFRISVNVQ
jgi:hypothetical protein